MTGLADDILRRQADLEAQRATWETRWADLAEYMLPGAFRIRPETQDRTSPTPVRSSRVYDDTAQLAAHRWASAMASLTAPQTSRWHSIAPEDVALKEDATVAIWCEAVTEVLFQRRYAPASGFRQAWIEHLLNLGVFGTGVLFVDERARGLVRYRALHVGECYLADDRDGRIDTVHRRYRQTLRQAAQRFGADKLPDRLRARLDTHPHEDVELIHAVMPSADLGAKDRRWRNAPWASVHILGEGKVLMGAGRYWSMPYVAGRPITGAREVYGRSPGMLALQTAKVLNAQERSKLVAQQQIEQPPLLASSDLTGGIAGIKTHPGAINHGALGPNGEPLVKPLYTGARPDVGTEAQEQRRAAINEAFLLNLFRVLIDAPQMTATEAAIRAEEKGSLMGPSVFAIQSESLSPLIEREVDILGRAGRLPEPPNAVRRSGGGYAIEYASPVNRDARDATAVIETFQVVQGMAQIDPSVTDRFDVGEMASIYAKARGLPSRAMRTPEAAARIAQARAQAQQEQQMLEAAPGLARAAKDAGLTQQPGRAA